MQNHFVCNHIPLLLIGAVIMSVDARASTETNWPEIMLDPHVHLPVNSSLSQIPCVAEEWEVQRRVIHERWANQLGMSAAPAPAPLNPRILSKDIVDGTVRRLEVVYGSEGSDTIRAFLMMPVDIAPGQKLPAVLVFHQTTNETINEPAGIGWRGHAFALDLAKRGFVTLSPESYIMKEGAANISSQMEKLHREHPQWTGMGKMVFDIRRSLDFLETWPEVDPDRIAAMGFSLGAKQVLYGMAFDDRIRAGVFAEGGVGLPMSNWSNLHYLGSTAGLPAGSDHHEVIALIAPRPFLIVGADDGGEPVGENLPANPPRPEDGIASWAYIHGALAAYRATDGERGLGLHISGFNWHTMNDGPTKELAYSWIEQWLAPASMAELARVKPRFSRQ
jgi:dienelactone hydrolase